MAALTLGDHAAILVGAQDGLQGGGGGGGGVAGLSSTGAGAGQQLTYSGSSFVLDPGTGVVLGAGGGNGALVLNDESNGNAAVLAVSPGQLTLSDSTTGTASLSADHGSLTLISSDGTEQFSVSPPDTKVYLNPALLPTSDPHVVGQLWNSTGVLHISAG